MFTFILARLRLTIWYIAIVSIVSLGFTAILYSGVVAEIEQTFHFAELRIKDQTRPSQQRNIALEVLEGDLENTKKAVLLRLLSANAIIIAASGAAGFILAGKTLKPIQEMVEEQKRFLADASHELKTPLTAMRTELEVSLRNKRLSGKEAIRLLNSSLEEVIRLQNLSENLIRLTRYAQRGSVEMESVKVCDIVDEAVAKVGSLAKDKKIGISKEIKDETASVYCERHSLVELLVLLLDNAVKYSSKNSVVTVIAATSRRNVVFKVKDQGAGIAGKDIDHLFDRFYRADSARSASGTGGYGLGLSIAKQIAERHDGEISVTSKIGKGSTFTVSLPR